MFWGVLMKCILVVRLPQQVTLTVNDVSCQPAYSVAAIHSLSLPGLNLLVRFVFSSSREQGCIAQL